MRESSRSALSHPKPNGVNAPIGARAVWVGAVRREVEREAGGTTCEASCRFVPAKNDWERRTALTQTAQRKTSGHPSQGMNGIPRPIPPINSSMNL